MGERLKGDDVDRGADAARFDVGAAGLVDVHRLDAVGRQVAEVESPRIACRELAVLVAADEGNRRGRHGAAVDRHRVIARAEAADRDLLAFTIDAVDRDAGDALEGVGQVGVRILAQVFGRNAVNDTVGAFLDVHGALQRAPDAGHHDDGAVVLRRRRGGLRIGRTGHAKRDRRYATQEQGAQHASLLNSCLYCHLILRLLLSAVDQPIFDTSRLTGCRDGSLISDTIGFWAAFRIASSCFHGALLEPTPPSGFGLISILFPMAPLPSGLFLYPSRVRPDDKTDISN